VLGIQSLKLIVGKVNPISLSVGKVEIAALGSLTAALSSTMCFTITAPLSVPG
jgi:hypothetical protein